jgi:hypothetical protein
VEVPLRRPLVDLRRDAVGREDEGGARGHVGLGLDEDRAERFQLADDVGVVDDLLADVDGGPIEGKGTLHRLNGALYPSAIPPR